MALGAVTMNALRVGRASLVNGDCLEVLKRLSSDRVDSVVTDPPYELGFMGKSWDASGIAYSVELWREVLRVLKPGGHLLAFGSSRTHHRIMAAIEDAGFEIRDTLTWHFGTGFPKSKNVGGGWGTALKPATEFIAMARKPLIGTVAANVTAHGTGALNVDGCRIAATDKSAAPVGQYGRSFALGPSGFSGVRDGSADSLGRWPANVLLDEWLDPILLLKADAPSAVREFYGHCSVSGVRVEYSDVSQQGEADQVLQQDMPRRMAVEKPDRSAPPNVRPSAQAGLRCENAREPTSEDWAGESELQRPLAVPGVQNGERQGFGGARPGTGRSDGSAGALRCDGAQASDGSAPGQAVVAPRCRPSPERGEDRQPAGEPGVPGRRHAQTGALGGDEGTARASAGGGTVEVCGSEVPHMWQQYFEHTGFAIRRGAAAELDAQSGERPTSKPGKVVRKRVAISGSLMGPIGVMDRPQVAYGDSGGASRFFYCAKPSRKERDMGCEALPPKTAGEMTGREDGSAGLDNPRAGAGRTGCQPEFIGVSAQWVQGVLNQAAQTGSLSQPPKDTGASTTPNPDGSEWSTCWCGSPSTDPFHPAIRSIIETKTSSTTESKTLIWSTRPHTNGCMAAAFAEMARGGSLASCAANPSPWMLSTGISAQKDGPSTDGASLATSVRSWLTSKPVGVAFQKGRNTHETVKPIALMRWLVRLVTPPGGIVLDPFLGSGTTGVAAVQEGFGFVGIERSEEYMEIAKARCQAAGQ